MNILSPLRDVSNNGEYATPSPGAKGKRSRMFGAASKDENKSAAASRMKPLAPGKDSSDDASSLPATAAPPSTRAARAPPSTIEVEVDPPPAALPVTESRPARGEGEADGAEESGAGSSFLDQHALAILGIAGLSALVVVGAAARSCRKRSEKERNYQIMMI